MTVRRVGMSARNPTIRAACFGTGPGPRSLRSGPGRRPLQEGVVVVERRTFDPEGDHPEAGGKEDRLLPWKQVKDVVGLSRSTAWRLQRIGDFPEPVRISLNRVGWWESELTAWKESRKSRKPLRPRFLSAPRAPRLIETARSSRTPPDFTPKSTATATATAAPSSHAGSSARRRRGTAKASSNQIDFGF